MVRILFTSGMGSVSRHIIPILLENYDGVTIRAIVPDKEAASNFYLKNNPTKQYRIEFIELDLDSFLHAKTEDEELCQHLFFGVGACFVVFKSGPQQPLFEKRFAELAIKYKVRHFVKHSVSGANINEKIGSISFWHAKSEEYLYDLCVNNGCNLTIIRGALFMQNLLKDAGNIKSDSYFIRPAPMNFHYRLPMVDLNDYAGVAAKVLSESGVISKHHNKTYLITGPQAFNWQEVSQILSKVLEKETSVSLLPIVEFFKYTQKTLPRFPNYVHTMIMNLYLGFERNLESQQSTPDFEMLMEGAKPKQLEAFVFENKQAFV